MAQALPIDDILDGLIAAVVKNRTVVVQAPPGAGKTTRVPVALLNSGHVQGRILMLEPRRLAARAAAERMASEMGERVGETVGYRIRGEAKSGARTRIEVVTEGILTRMLQSDPELAGIGAVIFDEFHERSLNADLGLALCLEVCATLRPDLILIAMSATLDAAPLAALMGDAPCVTSDGRAYPVDTTWRDRPLPKDRTRPAAIARDIAEIAESNDGGILVFLPGEGEIKRVSAALTPMLEPNDRVFPLFGAMKFTEQRAAIRPFTEGRKIVLATAIAETSLTIEDVRIVIDLGEARRARFDAGSGMSRLVTERVSKAEAEQRRGRAGRTEPGLCFRLWTRGEHGALAAYPPAEIETADLASFALNLAAWGSMDATKLALLTPPPPAALNDAQALLNGLGATDAAGRITPHGRKLATVPLHPRLAHMLERAGPSAAPLAALLSDRDPMRDAGSDLAVRLEHLGQNSVSRAKGPGFGRIRAEAQRLSRFGGKERALAAAQMAALAFPDRIGVRRSGSNDPRWHLSGGKGAKLPTGDRMANTQIFVITETDGHPTEAHIRHGLAISEAELRAILGDQIVWEESCEWSKRTASVVARRRERIGAAVLSERNWPDAPPDLIAAAMLDGVRQLGLPAHKATDNLRTRIEMLRAVEQDLPDVSTEHLLKNADDWLLPYLSGVSTAQEWLFFNTLEPIKAYVGWNALQRVDALAP